MILSHRFMLAGLPLGALAAGPAAAQTLDVTIQIPRINTAEYHAPYVAFWLEKSGATPRTIAIWYDFDNRENGGKKWLTDVRQWWRASGRGLTLPAAGVSGATRPPGTHRITFTAGKGGMPQLTPGQYVLRIEASRELGGVEALRLPFTWPAKGGRAAAKGSSELGAVALTVR